MPFPGPCSPPVATALGYTRKCTEWQIRITTRKSCSIFFFVRLFLHDIFLKFELLARYFFLDSTHPPHQKSNGPSLSSVAGSPMIKFSANFLQKISANITVQNRPRTKRFRSHFLFRCVKIS